MVQDHVPQCFVAVFVEHLLLMENHLDCVFRTEVSHFLPHAILVILKFSPNVFRFYFYLFFVAFYVVVDVSQLRVFLHDVRSRLQSSVFVGDRSHVDSLDLIGLGLQANLFEEVGDLMIMGLELLQNEGNQFEGRNAVDIDLAAGGVPLLYESEGKHDDVGEPVHHLVMTYNRQALKEMRRQGFLVLQVLRLLTNHSLQQKHCKLIDGGNVVLETQT